MKNKSTAAMLKISVRDTTLSSSSSDSCSARFFSSSSSCTACEGLVNLRVASKADSSPPDNGVGSGRSILKLASLRNASRSARISVALAYRRDRWGFIAFIVMRSSVSGMPSTRSEGDSGMERMCCSATSTGVSPSKGRRPVSISYITTPSEYRSARLSMSLPFACSGDT